MLSFNDKGADSVEFMASTNPGEELKPLISIASTGELSRFTLALKSALARNEYRASTYFLTKSTSVSVAEAEKY